MLGVPLEVVEVPEAAAYGAALLGGVAAGVWDSPEAAAAACVRPVAVVEPRAEWVARYAELHARYRALYPALARLAARAGLSAVPDVGPRVDDGLCRSRHIRRGAVGSGA